MIHTTVVPSMRQVQFEIPIEYVGKELEIYAFVKEEGKEENIINSKRPSDFFGTLSAEEGQKKQDYITQSRKEWEREI